MIILRTSVSLISVSLNPGVSNSTTFLPSRVNGWECCISDVQEERSFPTLKSLDPLARFANYQKGAGEEVREEKKCRRIGSRFILCSSHSLSLLSIYGYHEQTLECPCREACTYAMSEAGCDSLVVTMIGLYGRSRRQKETYCKRGIGNLTYNALGLYCHTVAGHVPLHTRYVGALPHFYKVRDPVIYARTITRV